MSDNNYKDRILYTNNVFCLAEIFYEDFVRYLNYVQKGAFVTRDSTTFKIVSL